MRNVEIYVIQNNGTRRKLVLGEDFSSDFNQESPVFDFDGVPGSVSIGVEIPVEGNEKTLRQAHNIESGNDSVIFNIEYFRGGEIDFIGKLIIESSVLLSSNDTFSVDIVKGDLPSLITGVKLRDILTEDLVIAEGNLDIYTAMNQANSAAYPDNPISFPTYFNEDHFSSDAEYFTGWINPFIQSVQLYEQVSTLQPGDDYYKPEHTFSPWLNLIWLLRRVVSEYGYEIQGSFVDDPQARKLAHITNFSIEQFKDGDRSEFLTTQDRNVSPGWVPFDVVVDSTNVGSDTQNALQLFPINNRGLMEIVVNVNAGNYTGNPIIHIRTAGLNGTGIQFPLQGPNQVTTFEAQITIDQADVGEHFAMFIEHDSQVQILQNTTLRFHNLTESTGFDFKKSVPLANLVPDISITKFIQAIRSLGVKIVIDDVQKIVNLDMQSEIFNAKIQTLGVTSREEPIEQFEEKRFRYAFDEAETLPDLTKYIGSFDIFSDLPLAPTGSVAHVKADGALYIYEVNQTLDQFSWEFLGKEQQFIEEGSGDEQEIQTGFIVPRCGVKSRSGQEFLVTILSQRGSGEAYGLKVEKGDLTLAFSHGSAPGSAGNYPMGSPFTLDLFGNQIGSWSLSCFQEDGVYQNEWSELLKVLQKAKILTKMVYGSDELRKKAWDLIIRHAHQNFFIYELTTQEGQVDLPSEVRLIKI